MKTDPAKPRGARRFWPTSLSRRILVGSLVTTTITYAIIATVVSIVLSTYTRTITREAAREKLSDIAYGIQLQGNELESYLVNFTEWNAFHEQTLQLDPRFIADEVDPWLKSRSGATVVVWETLDGDVLYSYGPEADVAAARSLARSGSVKGPVLLPQGPSTVAAAPIVGDPAGAPVGFLVLARPVDTSLFSVGVGTVSLGPRAEDLREDEGWERIEPPAGYVAGSTTINDGVLHTRGVLRGADGGPTFSVDLVQPDPWTGEGRLLVVIAIPVVLGLMTIAVGTWLGVSTSKSIGRPLSRFTSYLADQGYLAVQGLRADEELAIDPRLPEDFINLGNVISELMTQLRVNQAELIEASEQAVAAERAFRTVVEESPEVKILVRGGVVEIANPAAAHFFGLHLGDLVRADPRGLFEGIELLDEAGDRIDVIGLAAEAGTVPVLARCLTHGQPERWIEMSVSPVGASTEDYVISARNVTEERRLEALRSEILSLVSHDLRSPLTVVRGYLDILDRPMDDAKRSVAIESARRATQRMEGLLDDLLYATRAERVFGPSVLRTTDLAELASSVSASLEMSSGQTITTHASGPVLVLGDAARLEQAITNLVSNAVKHGPEDGEVRVFVREDDDHAYLAVEDDGAGVPPEEREHVFERGVRGPSAATTPGAGLGLYIARAITEAHGGTASAEDAASGGTRFVLRLPLARPEDDREG
jgi:signal transduction histidine kinase